MLVLNVVVVTGDDVIVCSSAGGSHNSRNLSHPPGGDASSDEGGRKRRDWTNHEFVRACRRLGWLANLSEEGSQSLDAVLSLSSELKLLFRLKEKSVVSEPVED